MDRQLSRNFTLAEVWKDAGTPTANQIRTCKMLVISILQPLRDFIGLPITITSGRRSVVPAGSSTTSEHFYNGDDGAIDINVGPKPSAGLNLQVFNWLATNCRYSIGQLIWYTETTHLHISLAGRHVGELLVCTSKTNHEYKRVSRASEIAQYDKRLTS